MSSTPEQQLQHEANAFAGSIVHDGRTDAGKALAEKFVATSNDAAATNGENFFAAAWFLSTCLNGLTEEQQSVYLSGVGIAAMTMHQVRPPVVLDVADDLLPVEAIGGAVAYERAPPISSDPA